MIDPNTRRRRHALVLFDIIQIDGVFKKDTVGVEMPDATAARAEAKRCLAEMAEEAVNQDLSELRIEVRDHDGKRVTVRAAYFDNEDNQARDQEGA